jgi:hypothetical protein
MSLGAYKVLLPPICYYRLQEVKNGDIVWHKIRTKFYEDRSVGQNFKMDQTDSCTQSAVISLICNGTYIQLPTQQPF